MQCTRQRCGGGKQGGWCQRVRDQDQPEIHCVFGLESTKTRTKQEKKRKTTKMKTTNELGKKGQRVQDEGRHVGE